MSPFLDGGFSPDPFVNPPSTVDAGTQAVCQIGFIPGMDFTACGSCRYSSTSGTLDVLEAAFNFDFTPAPVCPFTSTGLPLTPPP
jgi:hypothetical protein